MFKTFMGPVEEQAAVVYLRPETAQGIYVNYLNVLQSSRQKIPFGIAQIGKAFRNEITPGNFIFRTREFEQMEMQFFVKPGTDGEWFERWREWRMQWHRDLGLDPAQLRWHQHGPDELAHYARAAYDVEYEFPFGWQEIEGIHNRGDFDLGRHQEFSGKKLDYFDQAANERFLPYIVETSAGADRVTLTLLVDAYREEQVEGETRVVLGLHPAVAPIKAGVFPLVKKDGMPELATSLYHDLKRALPLLLRRQRRHRPALPADGRGGHARSASRWTARRCRPDRHGPPPGHDAAGAGRRWTRWRSSSAERIDGSEVEMVGLNDPMRLSDFEAMIRRLADEVPSEFLEGIAEIAVSPRTVPHPDRAEIYTLGECIPLPDAGGRIRARASRAASCSITARSPRWPGSRRVRLAGGGVGDADPRAAAPPRVAGPGAGAGGVRPRGRAEFRPPGR